MDAETMTSAEQAAEKQRKDELAAEIERMDDVELGLLAKRAGVDAALYPDRAGLVAAIELKAAVDAVIGRRAIRDADEQERLKVASESDGRPEASRIIRAINAELCRDIPAEARHGSFQPDEDDPRFGGDHDVKDGKYRVVGSDWVLTIRKGKLLFAEHATEKNKWGGKNVIAID